MQHEVFMRRCLELAQKAKGRTAPNPMVGALLQHEGRIIGEGWHQEYGKAHAEINCLNSVSEKDRSLIPESTLYVNLEPCAHYGNTPPCAVRVLEEKIKRVVISGEDPHEKVGGKGINILREGGAEVVSGILKQQSTWLNRRFFCFHQQQRPYIILKWAQSKEGYFAPSNRSRFQLSNMHSNQIVHKWRTEEAAILVGYQTALRDNPTLTARSWQGNQPLRIILDKDLKLSYSLNFYNADAPVWIINRSTEKQEGHIRFIRLDFDERLIPELLNLLHQTNKLSLIVEGGAVTLQSFIDKGWWDEARIFQTGTQLAEGLAAPLLTQAEKIFESEIIDDQLKVYLHNKTAFTFMHGMDL